MRSVLIDMLLFMIIGRMEMLSALNRAYDNLIDGEGNNVAESKNIKNKIVFGKEKKSDKIKEISTEKKAKTKFKNIFTQTKNNESSENVVQDKKKSEEIFEKKQNNTKIEGTSLMTENIKINKSLNVNDKQIVKNNSSSRNSNSNSNSNNNNNNKNNNRKCSADEKILNNNIHNQPLISTFKPVRGTKFSESLTFSFFKEVFLPQGFPKSVHNDYVQYQIWDTLQAFASTINGTLTTHSIMRGVGVGESTATPLVAAITWILKDGTGMIGRIIFAWWQGNNLDSQCKKWRLFADILNDSAMVIEVTVPYISTFSSYILCLTTGMKAIVGIAGGATRTAIMQHHAIKDNMADVSAKEHSQGTLVNLAGSIVGILILLFIQEKLFIYISLILVIIHIICNYFAVTSLQLSTLNEDRLCLIIEDYILYHSISSIEDINKRESVFILSQNPAKKIFGFDIESGISLKQILKMNLIHLRDVRLFLSLFQRRKYVPVMDLKHKKIYIILSKDSCDGDVLKAYFHSSMYAMIISRIIGHCPEALVRKRWCGPSYPTMRIFMFSKRFSLILRENESRVSAKFLMAVDEIVFEEYHLFNKLLDDSAWILKANMLPVKPWRGAWK